MGLSVRAFTRQHIVAIAVGVLVASAPLVAFNFWLSGVIDRQGQAETDSAARRMIALGESRVGEVTRALDDLVQRRVITCDAVNTEALQTAALVTAPIKEVAIVGPAGVNLCSHLNIAFVAAGTNRSTALDPGLRRVASSGALAPGDGYFLDVMNVANGPQMVRLRRGTGEGLNEIAALMPATLL